MRLNVAYSTDNNYVRHVAVSMISLFENNKEFEDIFVYIIDNNISVENKRILSSISKKYNRVIEYLKFEEICKGLITDNSYSLSSYARLFLSNINDIDKIIYLDCDSVINGSFLELWNMNLDEYYIGAVQDCVKTKFRVGIGLDRDEKYINAGFLLINLKLWRSDRLVDKYINFIQKFNGSVPHHDQGVINAVCRGKILILDPKYNLMGNMIIFGEEKLKKLNNMNNYYTQEKLNQAIEKPVFIHYTAEFYNRPWNKGCSHPLKQEYLKYLELTPWKNDIQDKLLCRNARIMKLAYTILPFTAYLILNKVIDIIKNRRNN